MGCRETIFQIESFQLLGICLLSYTVSITVLLNLRLFHIPLVLLQILFCLSMKILQIRLMWLRNWLMDNLFSNRISKFQTLLKFGPHTIVACDVMWLILIKLQFLEMLELTYAVVTVLIMVEQIKLHQCMKLLVMISTFPTGNTITVDTSSAASVNQLDTVLSFFPATFSPAIAQNDDAVYNIA